MIERGGGHIVFISSLSGKVASPRGSIYSATKFGLRGFALALREDQIGDGTGVGVSVVIPGFIRDAGMFADGNAKPAAGRRHRDPRGRRRGRDQGDRRRQGGGRGGAGRARAAHFAHVFPQSPPGPSASAGTKVADQLAEGNDG